MAAGIRSEDLANVLKLLREKGPLTYAELARLIESQPNVLGGASGNIGDVTLYLNSVLLSLYAMKSIIYDRANGYLCFCPQVPAVPQLGSPCEQVVVPDITDDATLVRLIDEIKYRLKSGLPYSTMRDDFNSLLNGFIKKWRLDGDRHAFATLPKEEHRDEGK